jgi:histidinol-phosphatase (PHP family)
MSSVLPSDFHVHSEWSWDARVGSMEDSCARAVSLGLPSIAFTEHFDLTRWIVPAELEAELSVYGAHVEEDGRLHPPPLDVDGYLAELERCRRRFPDLRILSGVELGEPHWHREQVQELLSGGTFERILGSQHSFRAGGEFWLADDLREVARPEGWSPGECVRAHLAATLELVERCDDFEILAHVDYSVRGWPDGSTSFPLEDHEEVIREILRALAASDRTLEVNTTVPLHADIVAWWRELGGRTVSFASDAHRPVNVGRDFESAVAMVEARGFGPGRDPHDLWHR